MIAAEEAWSRLESVLEPLPAETVRLSEALGRVLAGGLSATCDVPASDVSAMDGYAVAGELPEGKVLEVSATVAAGDPPGLALAPRTVARIMTGAPVPSGADRVVPVELTDGGDARVTFLRSTAVGAHIRRRAEVVADGQPLLAAGTLVAPGTLALAATHGHTSLSCHGAPRIALLVTGDEVVPPAIQPPPGRLRDSHTDFLSAVCGDLGLEVESLGIAPDRPEELRAGVARGLESDVLLLTGGVSMGEYDFVEEVLREVGCETLFDAVAVQPGKPLVAARHRGGLVFGLPGNPASVMVGFWLFVRPALRRLLGYPDHFWKGALEATLAAPLAGAKGRDRFLPAEVEFGAGRLRVWPAPPRGSHDVGAYARGTALVRIPAGSAPAEPGSSCQILPLADWRSTVRSSTSDC